MSSSNLTLDLGSFPSDVTTSDLERFEHAQCTTGLRIGPSLPHKSLGGLIDLGWRRRVRRVAMATSK